MSKRQEIQASCPSGRVRLGFQRRPGSGFVRGGPTPRAMGAECTVVQTFRWAVPIETWNEQPSVYAIVLPNADVVPQFPRWGGCEGLTWFGCGFRSWENEAATAPTRSAGLYHQACGHGGEACRPGVGGRRRRGMEPAAAPAYRPAFTTSCALRARLRAARLKLRLVLCSCRLLALSKRLAKRAMRFNFCGVPSASRSEVDLLTRRIACFDARCPSARLTGLFCCST